MNTFTRKANTRSNGGGWDEATIQAVWNKGEVLPNNPPATWRRDACGAPMLRTAYGNRNSQYGWEVDHIKPVNKSGSDDLSNLQPLQWENNVSKSDDYPRYNCAVPK